MSTTANASSSPLAQDIWSTASQTFDDTYNAIQTGQAKIGTITGGVDDNGNSITSTGLIDGQGNFINGNIQQVAPNVYAIMSGSTGGTMNTFVRVDPNTGAVQPVTDPSTQVTYTGGSKGGFIGNIARDLGPIPMIAASIIDPTLLPYVSAADTYAQTGDLTKAATSGALSYLASTAGNAAGQTVGKAIGSTLGEDPSLLGEALQGAGAGAARSLTAAEISSQGKADPLTALMAGGISGGVSAITDQIPGIQNLSPSGQIAVSKIIGGVLAGQPATQVAINLAIAAGREEYKNQVSQGNVSTPTDQTSTTTSPLATDTSQTVATSPSSDSPLSNVQITAKSTDPTDYTVSSTNTSDANSPLGKVTITAKKNATTPDDAVIADPNATQLQPVTVVGSSGIDNTVSDNTVVEDPNAVKLNPVTVVAKKDTTDNVVTPAVVTDTTKTPTTTKTTTPATKTSTSTTSTASSSPLSGGTTSSTGLPMVATMLAGAPVYGNPAHLQALKQIFDQLDPELAKVMSQPTQAQEQPTQVSQADLAELNKEIKMNQPEVAEKFLTMADGGTALSDAYKAFLANQPSANISAPRLLSAAPVQGSIGIGQAATLSPLKYLKQGIRRDAQPTNALAHGGLPDHYKEAAPKGHNPEFITGLTGYYANGKGTGQSDDIPAMLHDGDYVMDADTVASFGDGSSKAGAQVLSKFHHEIPHKMAVGGNPVPAKIADGEYVFPASFVTAIGGGDNKLGSKLLDKMREELRAHKRSAPDTKIPPKAKSPLDYLKMAKG